MSLVRVDVEKDSRDLAKLAIVKPDASRIVDFRKSVLVLSLIGQDVEFRNLRV